MIINYTQLLYYIIRRYIIYNNILIPMGSFYLFFSFRMNGQVTFISPHPVLSFYGSPSRSPSDLRPRRYFNDPIKYCTYIHITCIHCIRIYIYIYYFKVFIVSRTEATWNVLISTVPASSVNRDGRVKRRRVIFPPSSQCSGASPADSRRGWF